MKTHARRGETSRYTMCGLPFGVSPPPKLALEPSCNECHERRVRVEELAREEAEHNAKLARALELAQKIHDANERCSLHPAAQAIGAGELAELTLYLLHLRGL